ncbi:MAG: hypothetical protein ONB23_13555, partial [candidate division KSB1 bacterium]|nr:hypothetical protein [candidate division KSB1 bacterium]
MRGIRIAWIVAVALALTGMGALSYAQTNILPNGDLEDLRPNFWNSSPAVGGARCEWATDQVHQGDRSFKVVKPTVLPVPYGWMSVNNADLYWNDAKAGRLYTMGFWAKTE